jgi:hypothetical protein
MGHITNYATQLSGDANPTVSRWKHDETGVIFMLAAVGDQFRVAAQDQFGSWEDWGLKTKAELVELVRVDYL